MDATVTVQTVRLSGEPLVTALRAPRFLGSDEGGDHI